MKYFQQMMIRTTAATALLCAAATAGADDVRLLKMTSVQGAEIRLQQVAELSGQAAEALGDVVVARFDGDANEKQVSLQSLRRVLDDRDVNWGIVSLKGHAVCRVVRVREAAAGEEVEAVAAARQEPVTLDDGHTVQAEVEAMIRRMAGEMGDSLEIEFADSDADQLAMSVRAGRFELEPLSATALGRTPVRVRCYDGGRIIENFVVIADVARRVEALVAMRDIGRNTMFTANDLALQEVLLRSEHGEPLQEFELVLGQQASRYVRQGSPVFADSVRSARLVKRGELVTVRCVMGGLMVRTVGRATRDGAMDEVIPVRNEGSRETFAARVVGRRQVTLTQPGATGDEEAMAAMEVER